MNKLIIKYYNGEDLEAIKRAGLKRMGHIDRVIYFRVGTRGEKSNYRSRLSLLRELNQGDKVVFNNLSWFINSNSSLVGLINDLFNHGVDFYDLDSQLHITPKSKSLIDNMNLLAEISKRGRINRIKRGIKDDVKQGRPYGIGTSKLDKEKGLIKRMLIDGVSGKDICKKLECNRQTLYRWKKKHKDYLSSL